MFAQLARLQFQCAVRAIEEPRVAVQFGRQDRDARFAPRQIYHRVDSPRVLAFEAPLLQLMGLLQLSLQLGYPFRLVRRRCRLAHESSSFSCLPIRSMSLD